MLIGEGNNDTLLREEVVTAPSDAQLSDQPDNIQPGISEHVLDIHTTGILRLPKTENIKSKHVLADQNGTDNKASFLIKNPITAGNAKIGGNSAREKGIQKKRGKYGDDYWSK